MIFIGYGRAAYNGGMAPERSRPPIVAPEDVDTERTLSFANTLSGRPTASPVERLVSYDALLAWAREAGLLMAQEVVGWGAWARRRAADGARIVDRARALRELVHDTFTATSAGRTPKPETLAGLSARLSAWYPHGRLVSIGDSLQWAYGGEDDLERPLWEISRSVSRLLTSPRLSRVQACAAEDCAWWFFDDTKNGSRRWCDMKICGNRDKVRRYRARQR
jgi:predicted RNA-binding Zn ribbon-like protein